MHIQPSARKKVYTSLSDFLSHCPPAACCIRCAICCTPKRYLTHCQINSLFLSLACTKTDSRDANRGSARFYRGMNLLVREFRSSSTEQITCTRKTSSASTGLYAPAPPAKKGLAVAFVSVFATSRPTVACTSKAYVSAKLCPFASIPHRESDWHNSDAELQP